MDFDITSYIMGKAAGGGGGGGGVITPAFQGLGYGEVASNGNFYSNSLSSASYYDNCYELKAGKSYLFCIGNTVSTSFRASFYNGKTYEADFKEYVETSTATVSRYAASIYVTGPYDLSESNYTKRFIVTPEADGVLVVFTSMSGTVAPTYLIEIPLVS